VQGMWHIWRSRELHIVCTWGNLKYKDHIEDLCIDGSILKFEENRVGSHGLVHEAQGRD